MTTAGMNWSRLYFGKVQTKEVAEAVKDKWWQAYRKFLLRLPLQRKYDALELWLLLENNSRQAQVQVTNYVTALSRGGLIKVSDYRKVQS